jgi:polyisoprenoid-binding protein YceI
MTTSQIETGRLGGVWIFDRIHSAVTFEVDYLVAPFRLQFADFSAELVDGRLTGNIGAGSSNVVDEQLRSQLQGPDFFEIEKFPRASFGSTRIEVEGDAVTVEGELTVRDVTNPVRAEGRISGPLEDFMGRHRLGLSLAAAIDRTEYGLNWNAPLPAGGTALADRVKIVVDLEFIRAEED